MKRFVTISFFRIVTILRAEWIVNGGRGIKQRRDETFEWTFGSIRGGISGDLGSGKVGGSGTGERERSFSGKSQTADAWDPSAATSARFSTR